jgi:uncharacterized protein (TIGR00251 family)
MASTETLEVRVIPRSRRNELGGERAGRLLVRTVAPPSDGAANQAVRRMIAEHFDVPVRDVEILRGHSQRDKTVRVRR